MKQLLLLWAVVLFLAGCNKKDNQGNTDTSQDAGGRHNPYYSRTDTASFTISEDEWKAILPDSVFRVMRLKHTERAFRGKFWNYNGVGNYYCASCGNRLFQSTAKFASECGWPTFFETANVYSVRYKEDLSHGMKRLEVICGRCGGHLGHLFKDGPPPSHNRYCMNSIALEFEPVLIPGQ